MPWLFRKDIAFKVTKQEDRAQEQAKEPKQEPKTEALDAAELQKLQSEWQKALQDAWTGRYPNLKAYMIGGQRKLFYIVARAEERSQNNIFLRDIEGITNWLSDFWGLGCNSTPSKSILHAEMENEGLDSICTAIEEQN